MNHKATEKILNAIQPVCDLNAVSVSTQNKDYKGRTYESDLVTINERHNVGFEVFDNEIIVFYFTNHDHFDYDSSKTENNEEYAAKVIDFLKKLFTLPILYVKVTKGKRVKREEYFFIMPNEEESISGPIGHLICRNPFAKQITTKTTWKYDKAARDYINIPQKHVDPHAVCSITLSENAYFEIFEKQGVYSYRIMKKDFDEYNGMFYWVAFDDGTKSMFGTKGKAIHAAIAQCKFSNIETPDFLYNAKTSNMKKVTKDDYAFNIDIEKTKSFYSEMPKVFGISEYLPELTNFLFSLGIDIEKPVKYDLNDTYDLLYTAFGTVSFNNGYELDFLGEEKYVSVVVYSRENIITVEVFGIMLKIE